MAVDDRCRLCAENLRVHNTLTNTKKIFDAAATVAATATRATTTRERSVYERLAALGLTLSRHPSRSARVCRSCVRQLGRVEAAFAVFRRWVEAEARATTTTSPGEPEPPEPVPPPTSTSMEVPVVEALVPRVSATPGEPEPPEPPPPQLPPAAPAASSTSTSEQSTSTAVEKRSPKQHGVLLKMEEDDDGGGGGSASKPTTTSTITSTSTAGSGSGSGSEKRTREPSPAPETPGSAHKKVCPEHPVPVPPVPVPVQVRMLVPPATQTPTRKLSKETTRMPERRSLTKVIIYYPSHPKGEKITCQANTAGIVENITKQNWRRAANLIVRHKKLLAQLKENILKVIEEESQLLCNPYKGFMLWRSSAEDLKAFSFARLESDLRRMSPFTFSIFSRIAKQSPHATCAAAAIALRGREPRLSAFAYYVDCVLRYGGARKAVFIKLSKLGITTSHTCALGKQKELANACGGDFQLLKAIRKVFLNAEMDSDGDAEFESAVKEVEKAGRKKSAAGATGTTTTTTTTPPPKPKPSSPPAPTSATSTT